MATLTIDYNPYTNRFAFTNQDGRENIYFSSLTTREHALTHQFAELFGRLLENKITHVNCIMLKSDYDLFKKRAIENGIETSLIKEYSTSSATVEKIKNYYNQIKTSYDGYYKIIDDSGDSKIKAIQTHKREIEELIRAYNEVVSDTVKLAFVSSYSSGKSYLINSIIGVKMLPENPLPTTQFIHELTYGEVISLEYEYENGLKRKIDVKSLSELKDALNELKDINYPLAKNLSLVHIEYPFKTNVLNIKGKFKIVFYDTPGPSANEYEVEKLIKFFKEQKDTLPIFLLNKDSVADTENKKIFNNVVSDQFDTAYRFVFFNKCDELNSTNLLNLNPNHPESIISDINIRFMNPTIICGSAFWYLQEKYNNIENNPDKGDYDKLTKFAVCKYNQIFEGEKNEDICGVATLEDQINTYINNHAEYQKCFKAKTYLNDICVLSKALYKELLKEEKSRKEKKVEKFEKDINKYSVVSSVEVIEAMCRNQEKHIAESVDEMKKELKFFYNFFNSKAKEKQQKQKEIIVAKYKEQLLSKIKDEKNKLKSDAINNLNQILTVIKKDGSVPIGAIEAIEGLISNSNEKIEALSNEKGANLFKDTIFHKAFAIHELKSLLYEDKKTKKYKGKIKEEIEASINDFYLKLNDLFEQCKKDIKSKLSEISLIIKGFTEEIEKINGYSQVINEVEDNLQSCFIK